MEISFSSHGEIQIVTITGALGQAEGAAVRFKLEQKINQGRTKVLFDLGALNVKDGTSRNQILNIFSYSLNRGTLAACCGVPPDQWPLMLIPGSQQMKFFISRSEALDYLAKTVPPQIQKKAELGKSNRNKEEDLKNTELQKLLQKYEIFQHADQDDPLRLDFLAEQYKTHPSQEALAAESKAKHACETTRKEVDLLNNECDSLAGRVKSLMLMRKIPLSGKELELKQKTLAKEIGEGVQTLQSMKSQMVSTTKGLQEAKDVIQETQNMLDQELKELEKKLTETAQENDTILASLKAEEAQEQALLDKLKNP